MWQLQQPRRVIGDVSELTDKPHSHNESLLVCIDQRKRSFPHSRCRLGTTPRHLPFSGIIRDPTDNAELRALVLPIDASTLVVSWWGIFRLGWFGHRCVRLCQDKSLNSCRSFAYSWLFSFALLCSFTLYTSFSLNDFLSFHLKAFLFILRGLSGSRFLFSLLFRGSTSFCVLLLRLRFFHGWQER